MIFLHGPGRTGAEIFPKLSQEMAGVSKTARTAGRAERCGSSAHLRGAAEAGLSATDLQEQIAFRRRRRGRKGLFLRPLWLPEVLLPRQRGRALPRPRPGGAGPSAGCAKAARGLRGGVGGRGGNREGCTDFSSHRRAVVRSRQTLLCNN